ncbi:3-oxoadipate enol-lactonase [Saliniradius amylolyticus]|uniref:3-oxoadipate enol-lactonase n=1 Tax=Saliniradius amylolyticus TaxID=2183582 RepID=A0A2S2DZB9_9ALTE|nr:alpha/beta hydrolase [Saliniradius amylolyticus]AWL10699.1 3-oxoadipate enol-lactonase [Saliniradius amylolyticus]
MLRLILALLLLAVVKVACASSTLTIDGKAIEYEVKGDGPIPVLFDAGALMGMAGWDSVWEQLPSNITAIRFSRLGEGESDACTGKRSRQDYVAEVDKVLTALDIERPFVYVGHSFGGITARQFSAAHRGEVSAMLLLDPYNPHDVDILKQLDPVDGPRQIQAVKQADYEAGAGKWCFLDIIWDKTESLGYEAIGDLPVTLIAAAKVPAEPRNLFESAEGRKLWGQYQSDWVQAFPRGRAVLAEQSSHYVQDDVPELVVEELKRLLQRL